MGEETSSDDRQPELFANGGSEENESRWPAHDRFPTNEQGQHGTVGETVREDLRECSDPLIITGFASLADLVDFLPEFRERDFENIRLLLGHEPHVSETLESLEPNYDVGEEMRRYWLERGIDIHLCHPIVEVREMLEAGDIECRTSADRSRPVHAKIYVGQEAVTLGSSNFSRNGLRRQVEANARFTEEEMRAREARDLARRLWEGSEDYTDQLIELLGELLQPVNWQTALARACAELLEGEWAKDYVEASDFGEVPDLWPSQRKGVAEAMWIIENLGSVLVADATGSGKTRMGARLIRALQDRLVERGNRRIGMPVLVSPPMVTEHWATECNKVDLAVEPHSHGQVSSTRGRKHERVLDSIRRAQILSLDEAHKYLNTGSNRTQAMLDTVAEHVLLFTATPINRGVNDLIALLNLLGPDNLSDTARDIFEDVGPGSTTIEDLESGQVPRLREEIGRFTVRRTKTQLNEMIDREPEAYTNQSGEPCRFPKPLTNTYPLEESQRDRKIAREIRELADQLRGMKYLGDVLKPYEGLEMGPREIVESRKHQAGALARHHVMKSLRSSKAAVLEHVEGTEAAVEEFDLGEAPSKGSDSGNMMDRVQEMGGEPLENRLGIEVDDWLVEPEAHREACERDAGIYREIADLVRDLSDDRIRAKAEHLEELFGVHDLVMAFDSRPITLSFLHRQFEGIGRSHGPEVFVAAGASDSEKRRINNAFAIGGDADITSALALCTNAMSEGVNLQRASAIVHLDMPSVIRDAEQRVGRVDRMDSPYDEIEVWWPDDADEFALKSDETFVRRHKTVKDLMGSNFALPDKLQEVQENLESDETITAREMDERLNALEADDWDGIRDAFAPVRSIFEGEDALIDRKLYEKMMDSEAHVVSRVGLVESEQLWAFFTVSGGERGAPRWVLMDGLDGDLETQLSEVVDELRARLGPETENLDMTRRASELLEEFVGRLEEREEDLLPNRKQSALDSMRKVLGESTFPELRRSKYYTRLLKIIRRSDDSEYYDLEEVAERWLELLRPVRRELVREEGRSRLVTVERCSERMQEEEEFRPTEKNCVRRSEGSSRPSPCRSGLRWRFWGSLVEESFGPTVDITAP
jgi:superfamily II DNA or RNA helicase